MKRHLSTLLLLLGTLTLQPSCKNQTFRKTKNATFEIHSLDGSSAVKIKSCKLTYNPNADGFINLELENGAQYQAKSVDGGSFSSINLLLKESDALFDTMTTEVVVNKLIHKN